MPKAIGTSEAFMGVDNTIIEARVLELLYNSDITSIQTATVGNPETINAGTARFFIGELLQTNEYTQKGYETAAKITASEIDVILNDKREVRWGVETLDYTTFQSSSQLEGIIAGSLGNSIMAERAAYLIEATSNVAIALGQFEVKLNADTTVIAEQMREVYFLHTDLAANIEQTFSTTEIGTNRQEISIISAPKVKSRLIKEMSKAAVEMEQRTGGLTNIQGISFATNPLLGKKILAGQSFIKDKMVDFTNIQSLVFHIGSVAAPIAGIQVATSIDGDGNPNTIAKYILNKGTALRPTLIWAIIKEAPSKEQVVAAYERLVESYGGSITNSDFRNKTLKVIKEIHEAYLLTFKKGTAPKKATAKKATAPKKATAKKATAK